MTLTPEQRLAEADLSRLLAFAADYDRATVDVSAAWNAAWQAVPPNVRRHAVERFRSKFGRDPRW